MFRVIAGGPSIRFADAQASAYTCGDFLAFDDDDVAGKNRIAANGLGLNPVWPTERGGLFLMREGEGTMARALVSDFNRLDLSRVPRLHGVSETSRAGPLRRYLVPGWLRR